MFQVLQPLPLSWNYVYTKIVYFITGLSFTTANTLALTYPNGNFKMVNDLQFTVSLTFLRIITTENMLYTFVVHCAT